MGMPSPAPSFEHSKECLPAIPALRQYRPEDQKFKVTARKLQVSQGYIGPCLKRKKF